MFSLSKSRALKQLLTCAGGLTEAKWVILLLNEIKIDPLPKAKKCFKCV